MGIGNPRLVGFSGDKEVAVAIQDALFTTHTLAMLSGNDVTKTMQKVRRVEVKQVVGGVVSVDKQPVDVVSIREVDTFHFPVKDIPRLGVTFAGNEVTLPVGAVDDGKFVEISYDTTIAAGKNNTITVTATNFGGTKKMVVDVIVRDASTGMDYAGQFVADRVKVEEDFTFNFSPEGDPSVLDIPIQILKAPVGSDMYRLILFDADDLEDGTPPPVVVPVDKSNLIAAINLATGLDNADYTPETWAPFLTARTQAISVRDDADATQDDVDNATSTLTTAQGNLVGI